MKTSAYEALKERIESRDLTIAVIGLGYVGLPLATAFAEVGFRVTGIDVDEKKVRLVNRGISYIEDMDSERLRSLVDQGFLRATSRFDTLDTCDAVSICVPTPLRKTGAPDISHILSAADAIAEHLHPGMIVVLESTTYPGHDHRGNFAAFSSRGRESGSGEGFFPVFFARTR